MSDGLRLFSYWRSSAAYRVRIGLNLKGLPYETCPVHLVRDGGEQHTEAFHEANPQELVPVLQHGQRMLRQSLSILEYLDESWPKPPLLPGQQASFANSTSYSKGINGIMVDFDEFTGWIATLVMVFPAIWWGWSPEVY